MLIHPGVQPLVPLSFSGDLIQSHAIKYNLHVDVVVLKAWPCSFLYTFLQDMNLNFTPSECDLNFLTYFYWTDYGRRIRMPFLKLGYKQAAASIWANPSLPWITHPQVSPILLSALASTLTLGHFPQSSQCNPAPSLQGLPSHSTKKKSQSPASCEPTGVSDRALVTCCHGAHPPAPAPMATLLPFIMPGKRQPPAFVLAVFWARNTDIHSAFIFFMFAQNSPLQWRPLLSYELLILLPSSNSSPMTHTTSQHTESEGAQLCPTLCDPMDCSPPGSSSHGLFQARILEWVAISFFRGSSRPGIEPGSPAV